MRSSSKKFFVLFIPVLAVVFFTSIAHASFLDIIRAFVTINPLEVKVSAPGKVEIGKVFKIEARIINKGEKRIENVQGEIFLPERLVLLGSGPVRGVGVVASGKEKKISWSVRGEKIDNYVILVQVSGTLEGSSLSDEGSVVVEIIEKVSPGKNRFLVLLQRIFSFFVFNLLYYIHNEH